MAITRCVCGADCDFSNVDCSGSVEPIGIAKVDEWVHSCKAHRNCDALPDGTFFNRITDYTAKNKQQ
jgi:hypothetical protein